MKKIFLFSFASLLMLASCEKEVVTPVVVKSQTELLLHNGNAWRIAKATVDPAYPYGGTFITDYYAQLKDCYKDDSFLYSANPITATSGSVTLQNDVKCENTELAKYAGTWVLNANKTITTTYGASSTNEELLELTEAILVTKEKITKDGVNYLITWTYQ